MRRCILGAGLALLATAAVAQTITTPQQQRRGTATDLTNNNLTPLAGEIVCETDTNRCKLGTGALAWTSLPYMYDPLGAGGDATSITGIDVSTCSSDGDIMVYRTSTGDYECEAKPAAGENPAAADVSVSATPTNYSALTPDVEAHLVGIDTALASSGGGGGGVLPTTWRVTNNVSPIEADPVVDIDCFRIAGTATITTVTAAVVTAGSGGGAMTIDINDDDVTIMGTDKLDIQSGATVDDGTASVTAGTIAAGSLICAQIDAVSTSATELGLTITLE